MHLQFLLPNLPSQRAQAVTVIFGREEHRNYVSGVAEGKTWSALRPFNSNNEGFVDRKLNSEEIWISLCDSILRNGCCENNNSREPNSFKSFFFFYFHDTSEIPRKRENERSFEVFITKNKD